MLELIHVSKNYHKKPAVTDLSFRIEEGEVLGLLGENGAGKSTTLSMIATLMKPDQGTILFDGIDVVKHPKKVRGSFGYVPQEITLYEKLSGYDNIKFWGSAYHLKEELINERLNGICSMVSFLKEDLQKKVKEYSGGMKRKLNIIVALLHHPKLIILDEPTVGIDVQSRNQIQKGIIEIKKKGTSVIYVSHYMEEIESICDRIVVLKKGTCVFNATMKEISVCSEKSVSLEQRYTELVK